MFTSMYEGWTWLNPTVGLGWGIIYLSGLAVAGYFIVKFFFPFLWI